MDYFDWTEWSAERERVMAWPERLCRTAHDSTSAAGFDWRLGEWLFGDGKWRCFGTEACDGGERRGLVFYGESGGVALHVLGKGVTADVCELAGGRTVLHKGPRDGCAAVFLSLDGSGYFLSVKCGGLAASVVLAVGFGVDYRIGGRDNVH